tara:strand:+ start:454 stop:1212 length:759 start_codon:yes stop_codon:yes gene_type:complete
MKVIILAGGSGSRLGDITKIIPKPLVKIGKFPILLHIISIYLNYNINEFIIALGYKGDKIVEYFLKRKIKGKEKNKLKKGLAIRIKLFNKNCNIIFVNTGKNSMTGGRLKRAAKLIAEKNFYLTYGDGLSNVNINELTRFHFRNKKMVTVTAVRPPARFGELIIKNKKVTSFSEKKPMQTSWINGGFFIINKKFLKFIKNDKTILERYPLERVANTGQLSAFKHNKFWQCMDTKRDLDNLELLHSKNKPWLR